VEGAVPVDVLRGDRARHVEPEPARSLAGGRDPARVRVARRVERGDPEARPRDPEVARERGGGERDRLADARLVEESREVLERAGLGRGDRDPARALNEELPETARPELGDGGAEHVRVDDQTVRETGLQ